MVSRRPVHMSLYMSHTCHMHATLLAGTKRKKDGEDKEAERMAKAFKGAVDDLPDLGGKTKQPRKKRGRVKMKAPHHGKYTRACSGRFPCRARGRGR